MLRLMAVVLAFVGGLKVWAASLLAIGASVPELLRPTPDFASDGLLYLAASALCWRVDMISHVMLRLGGRR